MRRFGRFCPCTTPTPTPTLSSAHKISENSDRLQLRSANRDWWSPYKGQSDRGWSWRSGLELEIDVVYGSFIRLFAEVPNLTSCILYVYIIYLIIYINIYMFMRIHELFTYTIIFKMYFINQ